MKTKMVGLVAACGALAVIVTGLVFWICQRPVRGIPPGWSELNGDRSQWTWAHGRVNGHTTTGDAILASSAEYSDVTFSARVGTTNREASLAIRLQDQDNGYLIVFAPANTPGNGAGFVRLVKRVAGNETTLAVYERRKLLTLGLSAKMKVVARGPVIQVYLNGARILLAHDATFRSGYIGFRIYGWGDYPCDATFSSVRFR